MFLFKLTLASPAPTFFLSKLLIAVAAMLASSMFKSRALRTTIARKSDIVTYHPHNATRDVPEDGDMTERSHAGMPSLHSHQSCMAGIGCPVSLQMAAPSLGEVSRNLPKSLHLKPKKLY